MFLSDGPMDLRGDTNRGWAFLVIVEGNNLDRKKLLVAFVAVTLMVVALGAGYVLLTQTPPAPPSGAAPTVLGAAASFAVLAATAVTCTDSTVIGDVGVYPGTAVTQTNCPIAGTIHAGDSVAAQAQHDFVIAYDAFKALPCDQVLTGTLAGRTLVPGVYCFDAAATLTGVLTLNGPANGIWTFKIGTSGTGALTGTGFSVVMAGGGQPSNVYWWVAQAATLTDSNFVGTILAGAAITITRGTFTGDAFAKAAVTMTGTNLVGC